METTKERLGIARLKIHPGTLEEFKRLPAQCLELIRTKDIGSLGYEAPKQSSWIAPARFADLAMTKV